MTSLDPSHPDSVDLRPTGPLAIAPGLPASRLFLVLLGVEVALVCLYGLTVATQSWLLSQWFDLDAEMSVASWFSASQLLVIGLLALVAAPFSRRPRWPSPLFCTVVGLGFIFLSMDEAAMVHERITDVGRSHAWVPRFDDRHGTWIFAYGLVGLGLLAAFRRDILTVLRHHRRVALLMGGGFAVLVAGAVGVEVMGYYGLIASPPLQVAMEEFLEMFGATLILLGAVEFLNRTVTLAPTPPGRG